MEQDGSGATILVVDDEPMLVESLTLSLESQGYQVHAALDGPTALAEAAREQPDLVLLDLMLPGLDGIEVCRRLRAESRVPIIMLTARDDVGDKVSGLDVGADDYVTKPFVLRELLARVRAVLRRSAALGGGAPSPGDVVLMADPPLTIDDLRIEPSRHMVTRGGEPVDLSPKEFRLLLVLARSRGTALSRSVLIDQVWGDEFMGDEKTLDVHIRWLREKIERDPSRPEIVLTVRGTGYKLAGAGEP